MAKKRYGAAALLDHPIFKPLDSENVTENTTASIKA
jgi:hypothetical protein